MTSNQEHRDIAEHYLTQLDQMATDATQRALAAIGHALLATDSTDPGANIAAAQYMNGRYNPSQQPAGAGYGGGGPIQSPPPPGFGAGGAPPGFVPMTPEQIEEARLKIMAGISEQISDAAENAARKTHDEVRRGNVTGIVRPRPDVVPGRHESPDQPSPQSWTPPDMPSHTMDY